MEKRELDKATFSQELKALIEQNSEIKVDSFDQELDIDSFAMMLVITFTEEKLGVQLDMDVLDFDDFKSINVLVDLIYRQKAA